jgi:hypothetical protein
MGLFLVLVESRLFGHWVRASGSDLAESDQCPGFRHESSEWVDQPNCPFVGVDQTGAHPIELTKEVLDRGFDSRIVEGLEKRGQQITQYGAEQAGYWIGIQIDPKTRVLSGGATRKLPSFVEGSKAHNNSLPPIEAYGTEGHAELRWPAVPVERTSRRRQSQRR